jgi:phospholipid/cholesterol/gamma-HCH transport system substrate-binding protein
VSITAPLIKFLIFALVALVATAMLILTIGNINFRSSNTYEAEFSDVTGLLVGDDVRIAGVQVGRVNGIEAEGDIALVTFSVEERIRIPAAATADLRFRDLLGARFLALGEGDGRGELQDGDRIPMSRTQPALDLDTLFNGFRPLFAALSPEDTNRLAEQVIMTLQGEGPTFDSLLRSTASLTNTIADRDQTIGRILDNLTVVMSTIGDRDQQLSALIAELQRLTTGLAADREAIGDSLEGINLLTTATAGFLEEVRPPLTRDIALLREFVGNLREDEPWIADTLSEGPKLFDTWGGTLSYGTWQNFYVCEIVFVPVVNGEALPSVNAGEGEGTRSEVCR